MRVPACVLDGMLRRRMLDPGFAGWVARLIWLAPKPCQPKRPAIERRRDFDVGGACLSGLWGRG
jgi:hypothetical protein